MYYTKSGSKQIKQCKKYDYRIFENYQYSDMSGYEYYYTLYNYDKTKFYDRFCNYNLVLKYLRKRKGVNNE